MRELAQRSQLLDEQLTRTKVRLRRITTAVAPELVGRKGVGPDTAPTILVSVGDNSHRLRNERAFASLAGANPIPAIVRLATEPATRAYLERRVSEGRTKIEAIRCIKRYIAREVFAALPRSAAG